MGSLCSTWRRRSGLRFKKKQTVRWGTQKLATSGQLRLLGAIIVQPSGFAEAKWSPDLTGEESQLDPLRTTSIWSKHDKHQETKFAQGKEVMFSVLKSKLSREQG
jgi:hypothetical protein